MSSNRDGTHPGRPFGVTGGGFAEGQNDPEEFKPEKKVGAFGTGQEDLEQYPDDAKLGSFARGQQAESHIHEGTFAVGEDKPEK
ncbi:MAG TPA: hypothetical protein VGI55_14380 [Solirubrobacteraceae bacterium]